MIFPVRDIYFRRMERLEGKIQEFYSYDLDEKIRYKLIRHILENSNDLELSDLNNNLEMELGYNISDKNYYDDIICDFLEYCSTNEFLSAIELLISIKFNDDPIYRTLSERSKGNIKSTGKTFERKPNSKYAKMEEEFKNFIHKFNEIFRIEKVGYEIVPVSLPKLPYIVVPFNSEFLYNETIKYPLSLMFDSSFKGPLNEFEKALDDYRNSKYSDAIHEAHKSYESTLKTILHLKNIDYIPNDKIPKLVEKIRKSDIIDKELQSTFDSFWSVLQNGTPTIRNMEGIAHGQGINIKEIERSYADFVIRLAGTYIVFLIERYNETTE